MSDIKTMQVEQKVVKVLDKGYVRLIDVMGSDLSIVNAARASFMKESTELNHSDQHLLAYLVENGHLSPFRHCFATFEVKAPLMTARQWWKYVVGSDHTIDGWNEASRRYVTLDPEFYIPTVWRSAPEDKKQGSGEDLNDSLGSHLTDDLKRLVDECQRLYNEALMVGVAPEQARLFLPAYGLYVVWRWSASLQSICHFLNQRIKEDAQFEIQQYANAVHDIIKPYFPLSVQLMVDDNS